MPTAIVVIRFSQSLTAASLGDFARRLAAAADQSAHQTTSDDEEDQPGEFLVRRWQPCASAETERARVVQLAKELGAQAAWYVQVDTNHISASPDDYDDAAAGSWSNGPPPGQASVSFPIDGYREAIDEFDWYDVGIAVKFALPLPPGAERVLRAFGTLWLEPCSDGVRQGGVEIDSVHHAVHFWADRFTACPPEQAVHYMLWIMARLHEIMPILHATFKPASMSQKYGALLGSSTTPVILAGNPLGAAFAAAGFAGVKRWTHEQRGWSDGEIAMMMHETALDLLGEERAQDGLALVRMALELEPGHPAFAFTYGRLLLAAGDTGSFLDELPGFAASIQLQLVAHLDDAHAQIFGAALDILLAAPLATRVIAEQHASIPCGGSISSLSDMGADLIAALVTQASRHTPEKLGELTHALRPNISLSAANKLASTAYEKLRAKAFAEAITLFDIAITRDDLDLHHYTNATYAIQLDNSGIDPRNDRERAKRFIKAGREHAAARPAIYLNLLCILYELGELEEAYEIIEQAFAAKSVGPAEFEKEPYIASITGSDRFKSLCATIAPAPRPGNRQTCVLFWKDFPWPVAGVRHSNASASDRFSTEKTKAERHLHVFAETSCGAWLVFYAPNGTPESADTGPVLLISKDGTVRALGDHALDAIALIARSVTSRMDFAGNFDAVIAGTTEGESHDPLIAWLSKYGYTTVKNVAQAVLDATQKHRSIIEIVESWR